MDAKQIVVVVLKNPAFYAALLAFAHAVILYFWPNFPVAIMATGDALIAVIASAITGQMVIADQRRAIANATAEKGSGG